MAEEGTHKDEDAGSAANFAPLAFDLETYLPHLADCDLTDAQARELLSALWSIMVGFVDLGLRIAPVNRALGNNDLLPADSSVMIGSSSDLPPTTNKMPSPRAASAQRKGMDS